MALSPKNRKVVGGLVLIGALGGAPIVMSVIDFAGNATTAGIEEVNQVAPHVPGVIDNGGNIAVAGLAQFNKLNSLNPTTTTAAPAASTGE